MQPSRRVQPNEPNIRALLLEAVLTSMLLGGNVALASPVCGDVNDDGSVKTGDALLVLRKAVAQPVALDCSQYEEELATCETSLAGAEVSLSDCSSDLNACTIGFDSCSASLDACQSDLSACNTAASCGNGVIDAGEQCDLGFGNMNGETCSSRLGVDAVGTLACTPGSCTFDTSGCGCVDFDEDGVCDGVDACFGDDSLGDEDGDGLCPDKESELCNGYEHCARGVMQIDQSSAAAGRIAFGVGVSGATFYGGCGVNNGGRGIYSPTFTVSIQATDHDSVLIARLLDEIAEGWVTSVFRAQAYSPFFPSVDPYYSLGFDGDDKLQLFPDESPAVDGAQCPIFDENTTFSLVGSGSLRVITDWISLVVVSGRYD